MGKNKKKTGPTPKAADQPKDQAKAEFKEEAKTEEKPVESPKRKLPYNREANYIFISYRTS
jgi:hypothetical protein